MNKKKHHFTKKQTNAFFLSALAAAAALQLTACAETAYIPEKTTGEITEAIASDTTASTLRTEPSVDLAPVDTEMSFFPKEETSSAEITSTELVAETTTAETTTAETTTIETTAVEATTAQTTAETTAVETTTADTTSAEAKPMVEIKTEESYRTVHQGTRYVYSDDHDEGVRFTSFEGSPGKVRVIVTKTYENGKLIDKDVKEIVIAYPADRVVVVGTRAQVTTETITVTEDVLPFATVYEYDDTRYDDEEIVLEEGRDGQTIREYLVTYRGDAEIAREMLSETKIEMIPRRILVGTKPSVTHETVTVTENVIPFETEIVYDDTMDAGREIVRQEGADGYTLATYRVTYYKGTETARELTDSVTCAPMAKIVAVGTKETPKEETFGLPYIDAVHGGVDYNVTQHYGNNGHGGMDIAIWYGDPIVAVKSGTVVAAHDEGDFGKDNILWTYGTYVVIEHEGGVRSYYAHMKDRTVNVGDTVSKGEIIGHSGNTGRVNPMPSASNPLAGTHLHFEIRVWTGYGYATRDPRDYLPGWWGG